MGISPHYSSLMLWVSLSFLYDTAHQRSATCSLYCTALHCTALQCRCSRWKGNQDAVQCSCSTILFNGIKLHLNDYLNKRLDFSKLLTRISYFYCISTNFDWEKRWKPRKIAVIWLTWENQCGNCASQNFTWCSCSCSFISDAVQCRCSTRTEV